LAPLIRLSVGANHRLRQWLDMDDVSFCDLAAEGSTLTFATFGAVPWFGLSLRTRTC
jgi:hypothetical protein